MKMVSTKRSLTSFVIALVAVCGTLTAQAQTEAPPQLNAQCDKLFNLPSGTQSDSNPYLNSKTCAAYQDLLLRFANCSRIQLDHIDCTASITKLNPAFAANLDSMLKSLSGQGYVASIISATYNAPTSGTVKDSNHYYGCAVDIVVSGWNTTTDRTCTSAACKATQLAARQSSLQSVTSQLNHFQPSGAALAQCRSSGPALGASLNSAITANTPSLLSGQLAPLSTALQSPFQNSGGLLSQMPTMQPVAVDTQSQNTQPQSPPQSAGLSLLVPSEASAPQGTGMPVPAAPIIPSGSVGQLETYSFSNGPAANTSISNGSVPSATYGPTGPTVPGPQAEVAPVDFNQLMSQPLSNFGPVGDSAVGPWGPRAAAVSQEQLPVDFNQLANQPLSNYGTPGQSIYESPPLKYTGENQAPSVDFQALQNEPLSKYGPVGNTAQPESQAIPVAENIPQAPQVPANENAPQVSQSVQTQAQLNSGGWATESSGSGIASTALRALGFARLATGVGAFLWAYQPSTPGAGTCPGGIGTCQLDPSPNTAK